MEATEPLTTVVPFLPALIRRPGPVCVDGEVVFQPAISGKYVTHSTSSPSDPFSGYSTASIIHHSFFNRTLGRTDERTTEAPYPPAAVEPFLSSTSSRPGPACGCGDGVFQAAINGKYIHVSNSSSADSAVDSSTFLNHTTPTHVNWMPGRTYESTTEAPYPSATVQPLPSSANSRPAPVCASGDGVFQATIHGKYSENSSSSSPDPLIDFSALQHLSTSTVNNRRDVCSPAARPDSRFLCVYYQNVRGLRTKTNELRLRLSSCEYDIVVLTETWLRSDISNSELSSDYSIFRCDRSESTSNLTRGGGVIIAVKRELHCEEVSLTDCSELEQVAVCVKLTNRSLYIFGIYLRPNSDPLLYSTHSTAVQRVSDLSSDNDVILLLGDYNLPHLQWNFDDDVNGYLPANVSSEQEIALTESILTCGLVQINSISNRNSRVLDLVFTSSTDIMEITQPVLPLLPIDDHHPPLLLQIDVSCFIPIPAEPETDIMDLDFRRCDFTSLNSELSSVDWHHYLQGHSVDANVLLFYDKLYEIFETKVPRRRRTNFGVKRKPWWTAELRNMRNRLRKARNRYFATKSVENRDLLRLVESSYNELLDSSYRRHLDNLQANVKNNPSMFWKFVKAQKSNSQVPNTVSYGDAKATTSVEAANLFASFFQSVFNSTSPQPHPGCFQNVPSHDIHLPLHQVSQQDVLKALCDLDVSKGAGIDGLTPYLLKSCADSLVGPLTLLFNRSLSEKTFPGLWKSAKMIPIHKSGSMRHVENYRGISILCCLGKVLESIVHKVILSAAKSVISEYQHGFVPQRSATSNLLCYSNVLFREVEMRHQVDSIYVDFSKAFDTVPHHYAVEKLRHMGFPDWIVDWILSYLTGRKTFVQVNSSRSNTFSIPSGVPQGSVLGPLIFVLYINDLCNRISSAKLLYADDLKIFRVIKSILDCVALQTDIDALLRWCDENGMSVNIRKCKVITFCRCLSPTIHVYTITGTALERVLSIRDLGVIMDSKLRFNEHISTVTAKAFAVLGFIRRNASQFTDVYALKALFCALVRSILEYAAPIWTPHHTSQIVRIERIQKLFIRFALRHLPWNDPANLPDYPARCQLVDLELLSSRRLKLQRLFVYDILKDNIDCSDLLFEVRLNVPSRRLRNSALIAVPVHRTSYGYNNPLSSCLRNFNNVCDLFDFNMSKECFKSRIKNLG